MQESRMLAQVTDNDVYEEMENTVGIKQNTVNIYPLLWHSFEFNSLPNNNIMN